MHRESNNKLNEAVECYFTDGDDKPCMISQKCAADRYLRTRIHYKLKFMNRDISLESKRKNRKAVSLTQIDTKVSTAQPDLIVVSNYSV